MNTISASQVGNGQQPEEIEGIDTASGSWGDYPIDDLLIRQENRTIHDIIRRVDRGGYIMDPEFQRDFIWSKEKQSKLIESVVMRIPLPVFYLAENDDGRVVVVDGLQRLTTFQRMIKNELKIENTGHREIDGKYFSDFSPKIQNRIEDCNLILYIIDSKVPERARLDIFDRVNGGVPLSRQQMRNCLFMGQATKFLREEANTNIFAQATGGSLNKKTMRDREFVNRFCAFKLLGTGSYRGDMDDFLAKSLVHMNKMKKWELSRLSTQFQQSMKNNHIIFKEHSFRKINTNTSRRSVLNASLWDVMSTGFSVYEDWMVEAYLPELRRKLTALLKNESFIESITYATSDTRNVKTRFRMARKTIEEILGDHKN